MTDPICFRCRRPPAEIPELALRVSWRAPSVEAVARLDPTYNERAGTFACPPCLDAVGGPDAAGPGWRAPAPLPPVLSHAVLHGEVR